ncbi:hypothetical protein HMI56_007158 [Coelomomyces lativittatus]|nr:hypothetical protein HMI56_007158 [Coelomomyces lativittatus]
MRIVHVTHWRGTKAAFNLSYFFQLKEQRQVNRFVSNLPHPSSPCCLFHNFQEKKPLKLKVSSSLFQHFKTPTLIRIFLSKFISFVQPKSKEKVTPFSELFSLSLRPVTFFLRSLCLIGRLS